MAIDHIVEKSRYYQKRPPSFIDNLEELVAKRIMRRPRGPVRPVFSYARRVPFAQVNGELIWYFDMDPAAGGTVGQIVYEDAEDLTLDVVAESFDDLLNMYIRDLGRGEFFPDDENGQIRSSGGCWYANPNGIA